MAIQRHKVTPPSDEEIDPDKEFHQANRKDVRRQGKRRRKQVTGGVHSILKNGVSGRMRGKTGSPIWFQRLKFDAARRKALSNVEMRQLAPAVGGIANRLQDIGYDTVWKMSQEKDINAFLVHGLQSTELRKLRDYLATQNVPVNWWPDGA